MSFRRTEWPANGPQLIELDSCICRKSLIINIASTRIRTGDLLITNHRVHQVAFLIFSINPSQE